MRKLRRIVLIVIVLIALVPVLAIVIGQTGPKAPVPPLNPAIPLDARHANVIPNAFDEYAAAIAAYDAVDAEKPTAQLTDRRSGDPLPPEVGPWLAANAPTFARLAAAGKIRDYWAPLFAKQNDETSSIRLRNMRQLARLAGWRAHAAAEQHDRVAFADAMRTMDQIGRHVAQTPTLIAQLVAVACESLAQSLVLEPLAWPGWTADDTAAYAADVAGLFAPWPSWEPTFTYERDASVWSYISGEGVARPRGLTLVAPAGRVAYEYDQCNNLVQQLAQLPLTAQTDPNNPLRLKLSRLYVRKPHVWNIPSLLSKVLTPNLDMALQLRARLLTQQRGNQLVLALFAARAAQGAFPTTLAELARRTGLAPEAIVDPFSADELFVYRCTPDGFTLYSRGIDRDDDGGQHDRRFGAPDRNTPDAAPDGDFVFWPLPAPALPVSRPAATTP